MFYINLELLIYLHEGECQWLFQVLEVILMQAPNSFDGLDGVAPVILLGGFRSGHW